MSSAVTGPDVHALRQRWTERIKENFDALALTIVRLREIAADHPSAELDAALDDLHRAVCAAANTDTFRMLLNGYISDVLGGCDEHTIG